MALGAMLLQCQFRRNQPCPFVTVHGQFSNACLQQEPFQSPCRPHSHDSSPFHVLAGGLEAGLTLLTYYFQAAPVQKAQPLTKAAAQTRQPVKSAAVYDDKDGEEIEPVVKPTSRLRSVIATVSTTTFSKREIRCWPPLNPKP